MLRQKVALRPPLLVEFLLPDFLAMRCSGLFWEGPADFELVAYAWRHGEVPPWKFVWD